ncbi:MAG: transposase [Parachlamydiaceae bacterium]
MVIAILFLCLPELKNVRTLLIAYFINLNFGSISLYINHISEILSKLHIKKVFKGEILAFQLSSKNISNVSIAETLFKETLGKLFGNKGSISSNLEKSLLDHCLDLFTSLRSNMKQRLMPLTDKMLLKKRSIIETVNDQLENIFQC